jgi:hypothetical protein
VQVVESARGELERVRQEEQQARVRGTELNGALDESQAKLQAASDQINTMRCAVYHSDDVVESLKMGRGQG